jgi:hypothetical protein
LSNSINETLEKKQEIAAIKAKSDKVCQLKVTGTVIGNDVISILKHNFHDLNIANRGLIDPPGIDISIRNVSNLNIATALFEAVIYDIDGNILDTIKHQETELSPDYSRCICINLPIKKDRKKVDHYNVRIIRITTTEVEKVQLHWHETRSNDDGQEEIRGVVKNVSSLKSDAALIANFYNPNKDNIGGKIIILKDIEPNSVRQFHFKFKPQVGDIVKTYTLNVIYDIEEEN